MADRLSLRLLGGVLSLCLASCGLVLSFEDYGTHAYSVSGLVTGLDGQRLTIVLEGHRQFEPSLPPVVMRLKLGDGTFAFPRALFDGAQYAVSIENPPAGRACSVEAGTGTIVGADVTGVLVRCAERARPTVTDGSAVGADCVATINEYRARHFLLPYARWLENESCADAQATADAQINVYRSRLNKCGEHTQNECGRWPGPPSKMISECLLVLYSEGPGGIHYDPMMSNIYTKVACGFGLGPDGTVWAVQDFR